MNNITVVGRVGAVQTNHKGQVRTGRNGKEYNDSYITLCLYCQRTYASTSADGQKEYQSDILFCKFTNGLVDTVKKHLIDTDGKAISRLVAVNGTLETFKYDRKVKVNVGDVKVPVMVGSKNGNKQITAKIIADHEIEVLVPTTCYQINVKDLQFLDAKGNNGASTGARVAENNDIADDNNVDDEDYESYIDDDKEQKATDTKEEKKKEQPTPQPESNQQDDDEDLDVDDSEMPKTASCEFEDEDLPF